MLGIKNIMGSNKGAAGILALVAVIFLGGLGAAYFTLSRNSINIATITRDDIAAQNLAEAGVQWAIAQIKANSEFTTNWVTSEIKNKSSASTRGTYKVQVTNDPNDSNIAVIRSIGTVNNSSRTITINVKRGGSNSGVFKYAAFSKGNMVVNSPKINGDIASNADITINSHSAGTVTGAAYCSSHTIWNQSAVSGGFYQLPGAYVLDVYGMMISMPGVIMQGTDLRTVFAGGEWSGNTFTLDGSFYYYNGDYGMYGHGYKVPSGKSVTIYVNGDYSIGKNIIVDGNITIYTTGNLTFNGGSIIGTSGSKVELYVNKVLTLNSGSSINGGMVTILANNSQNAYNAIAFNGGFVNKEMAGTITKIYARGNVALNDVSVIAGKGTGMLVATGSVALNGGDAPKTVIIAQGNVAGNSGSVVGGIYTNGTLNMNGATINYDKSTISTLNISSAGDTASVEVSKYSDR